MKKHPCVFSSSFIREQVDPRIKELWEAERGGKAPFGELRRLWQSTHCPLINPYGSESCPYSTEDCSLAFLQAVKNSVAKESPVGYFKSLARSYGIDRAERKPLARDATLRTYGQQAGAGGLRSGSGTRPPDVVLPPARAEGQAGAHSVPGSGALRLRREDHESRPVPQSIGSLLRGDDPRSRTQPYRRNESETSADHDGDRRDPVRSPSPGRMGDKPSPGDPGVHQGGE